MIRLFLLCVFSLLLSGCDQLENRLGLEDPAKKAARLEAEGRAVGGGCRQSGRAIEDCYAIYTWVPKEAVFEGWREMDAYMRENNMATITPLLPPPPPPESGKKKKKAPPPEEVETPEDAPAPENAAPAAPNAARAPIVIPVPASTPISKPAAAAPGGTPSILLPLPEAPPLVAAPPVPPAQP
ncbi:MAG: hypothetical protein LBU11_05755 [Zoogloeaceae bacterium]|nr:hypothetical protein [Zoogloeaceae bacterium]